MSAHAEYGRAVLAAAEAHRERIRQAELACEAAKSQATGTADAIAAAYRSAESDREAAKARSEGLRSSAVDLARDAAREAGEFV